MVSFPRWVGVARVRLLTGPPPLHPLRPPGTSDVVGQQQRDDRTPDICDRAAPSTAIRGGCGTTSRLWLECHGRFGGAPPRTDRARFAAVVRLKRNQLARPAATGPRSACCECTSTSAPSASIP